MQTWRSNAVAPVALLVALLAGTPAWGYDPPPNQLSGVVVYKDTGQPAANVHVVMVHRGHGYLSFNKHVYASGNDEKVLRFFTRRNGKHFCHAVSDQTGHFTLTNFAAPADPWHIAAGDADQGWTLQLDLRPANYAERPLRLELEQPAYIVTTLPPPPEKGLKLSVRVSLAPPEGFGSQTGEPDDSGISFLGLIFPSTAREQLYLGPLPPGLKYRVTALASTRKIPYDATVFARSVAVAAGTKQQISFELEGGTTVTGRVTSIEGQPLAKVNVMAETADGLVIGALTHEDGTYTLRGVPPGTHTLRLLRHVAKTRPG